MKSASILLASLCTVLACSCSSVEMPTGNSKGYASARFVKSGPTEVETVDPNDPAVSASKLVEEAITAEFTKHGITMGDPDANLVIAYMLMSQGNSSTTMQIDHFGSGRDPEAILNQAHEAGVIKNKTPDAFETGAIVIDLLDVQSNKLVSRTFAKRSLVEGISDSARRQLINSAVAEALAPFFQ